MLRVEVSEEQRQLILYALAHLAVERPLWDAKLASVAAALDTVGEDGLPQLFFALKLQEIDPLFQLRGEWVHKSCYEGHLMVTEKQKLHDALCKACSKVYESGKAVVSWRIKPIQNEYGGAWNTPWYHIMVHAWGWEDVALHLDTIVQIVAENSSEP